MNNLKKKTNKIFLRNFNKLSMTCKMINEIRSGLHYWKFDQIWPTNLYDKTLQEVVELINQVLFSSDFFEEDNLNEIHKN